MVLPRRFLLRPTSLEIYMNGYISQEGEGRGRATGANDYCSRESVSMSEEREEGGSYDDIPTYKSSSSSSSISSLSSSSSLACSLERDKQAYFLTFASKATTNYNSNANATSNGKSADGGRSRREEDEREAFKRVCEKEKREMRIVYLLLCKVQEDVFNAFVWCVNFLFCCFFV